MCKYLSSSPQSGFDCIFYSKVEILKFWTFQGIHLAHLPFRSLSKRNNDKKMLPIQAASGPVQMLRYPCVELNKSIKFNLSATVELSLTSSVMLYDSRTILIQTLPNCPKLNAYIMIMYINHYPSGLVIHACIQCLNQCYLTQLN